jgi:hypothetical protein
MAPRRRAGKNRDLFSPVFKDSHALRHNLPSGLGTHIEMHTYLYFRVTIHTPQSDLKNLTVVQGRKGRTAGLTKLKTETTNPNIGR